MADIKLPKTTYNSSTKQKKRFNWRKFSLAIVIIFLLMPILFISGCWILYGSPQSAMQLFHYGTKFISETVRKTPPFHGKSSVNILVLGADVSFGATRTDTIKLMRIDFVNKRISTISIPRDTWVELPNGTHGRINGAHSMGGNNRNLCISYARSTVQNFLSDCYQQPVPIDYVIRIQTDRFVSLVDALGGIDIDVEKRMKYSDPSQDLFIDLQPGMQHLSGYQTMCYVRFRHDKDGDYGRIRRQDQFIRTLASKLQNANHWDQVKSLGPLLDMVYCEPTIEINDVVGIKKLINEIGMDGIEALTIPTVPTEQGKAQVVEVQDRNAAFMAMQEFNLGIRPTVTILNGSGVPKFAQTISDTIDDREYNIEAIGNTTEVEKSAVYATDRFIKPAKKVAALLEINNIPLQQASVTPNAEYPKGVTAPLTPSHIIIVIGTDCKFLPKKQTSGIH